MTIIEEGQQRLTFDDTWQVVKFDEHVQHKTRAVSLQGEVEPGKRVSTRAVDIVAVRKGQLYLIELKDFRLAPGVNRHRWLNEGCGLRVEVPAKVRDTVATLVGALRHSDCDDLRPMARALLGEGKLKVALLLETGYAPNPNARNPNERQFAKLMMNEMKERLCFLDVRPLVLDQTNLTQFLPGLTVTNLPGATLSP
ncbi:hypothetical protein L6R49_24445 [Myxococcota bacterium]|nr:hypothetical protein [Myxococcota bacterium]